MTARRTKRTLSGTLAVGSLLAAMSWHGHASAYSPMRAFSNAQPQAGGTCSVNFPATTDSVTYNGGQVISSVQAVPVFWTSGVDPTVQAWAEGYLGALVGSDYFDLLGQYSTTGQTGGTGQTIGRGTVGPAVTITPTTATGTSVSDSQIGPELQAQITAKHLAPPTKDAQGFTNTVYVLFFPQSISVQYGGGSSCGAFCGYHGGYPNSGSLSFAYAVIPDMGAGSKCATGCSDQCTTADTDIMVGTVSHELAESVTDPANNPAWVNPSQQSQNSEIGDICTGNGGTQTDTGIVPGTNINAQYEWSQRDLKCLLANPGEDAGAPPVDAGSSSGAADAGSSSGGKDAGGSGSGGSSGGGSGSSSGGSSGGGSGSGGSSGSSSGGTHAVDGGSSSGGTDGGSNFDAPGGQGGGGCGCRVLGGSPDEGAGIAALAGLAVLAFARRDRRRKSS